MDDYLGAFVINRNPPENPKNKRLIPLNAAVGLVVLALVLATSALYASKNWSTIKRKVLRQEAKQAIVKKGNVSDLATEGHPTLFYADLEYDMATRAITQVKIDKTSGDLPPLLENQPSNRDRFVYKIEVISDKNELLQSGWNAIHREVILTDNSTLRFGLVTVYSPNAHVRMYVDNQLVWTARME